MVAFSNPSCYSPYVVAQIGGAPWEGNLNEERQLGLEFVESYGAPVSHGYLRAFDHYRKLHEKELAVHRSSTRANVVCDYSVENLRAELHSAPDIRFFRKHNATYFVFKERLLLKLKKLDPGLRASNVKTRTSDCFREQGKLDFAPDMVHAYLGYILDNLGTKIERILMVCPNQNGVAWWLPIFDNDLATGQRPIEFPSAPRPNTSPAKHFKKRGKATGGKASGGDV